MDWKIAEQLLMQMSEAYTGDDLRKMTFNSEIFPLVLRFHNGERSPDLYNSIETAEKILMKDIYVQGKYQESCKGFFMNLRIKPSYEDLLEVIGSEKSNWSMIFDLLRNDLRLKVNFKFDETVGWVLEFSRSGMVVIVLIPDKNSFKVNIPAFGWVCQDVKKVSDIHVLYSLINDHVKFRRSIHS